ncbi:protein farnesyltransferase/geranylgeranyltransferase type-1 subunit alpha-like [Watersipora subatra]|uniref:protein farnesyltransferase/geranylgeranyltransferase type-1 subunit alpha-like n=1 Tax=Watersipora subatra TaxID=2589382 RepID=UPI00355B0C66
MAESSSESDPDDLVLYSDSPAWKDVTPIPQDDGPAPIVAIAYSEQFSDVYNHFRAVLRSGEKSERVLSLTRDAIRHNPANYTVWHYRRLVLQELKSDLNVELAYITKIIKCHPKNYQVWYHRQLIVDWLGESSQELDFTAHILSKDAKNYHAWQHRQWVIQKFSLWSNEMEYASQLITDDLRNNSAWNQRYFVLANTTDLEGNAVQPEIEYTLGIISKARNNESAWNYLRGLVTLSSYNEHKDVCDYCHDLYEANCRSPYLLSMLVDINEELIKSDEVNEQAHLDKALQLCAELAMEFDIIRAFYWTFIGSSLEKKYRKNK